MLKKMLVLQEALNIKYNGEDWRDKVSLTKAKFAILDEVSEFLREIESTWKWWKHNGSFNRQKAVYELIDIVHFGLLVVLHQYDLEDIQITMEEQCATSYVTQIGGYTTREPKEEFFIDALCRFLGAADNSSDIDDLLTTLSNLIQAGGELIDVTEPAELFTAYVMKNQRNHERVDGGILTGQYDKTKETDVPNS